MKHQLDPEKVPKITFETLVASHSSKKYLFIVSSINENGIIESWFVLKIPGNDPYQMIFHNYSAAVSEYNLQ